MARKSAAEMEQKVQILRQITGGKTFSIKGLPDDILNRLGYANENGLYQFIHRLSTGEGQCGRRLNQVGHHGQYAWLTSLSCEAEPAQSVTVKPSVANHPISHPAPVAVLPKEPKQLSELQQLAEEKTRLSQEVDRLAEENKKLRAELEEAKGYVQLVEAENANLETKLGLVKEAEKSKKEDKQEVLRKLSEALPKEFVWGNDVGQMVYKSKFLEELSEFPAEIQKRVIEQMEVLGKNGMGYPSLHTKRIKQTLPYSPQGCLASRGTDEIRFTWQKNGPVMVYWVYRKGDSRVRDSER